MALDRNKLELSRRLLESNIAQKYGKLIIVVILGVVTTYFLAPIALKGSFEGNGFMKLVLILMFFGISCGIIVGILRITKTSKAKTNVKAVILAAGKSKRWTDGFEDRPENFYFWGNLGLNDPGTDQGSHKALAKVNGNTLVEWAITKFQRNGFRYEDINVVVSNSTKPQREIAKYLEKLNALSPDKVPLWPIDNKTSEIAYSTYFGLAKIPRNYRGDVVVAYSDIVWEDRLLIKLLEHKEGDIVILVDEAWLINYPPERTWHDTLCAEVVFEGDDGQIERIGEAVHRFEGIPQLSPNSKRAKAFEGILNKCSGEVVGLFKFSDKGRRYFVDEFARIMDSTKKISPAKWKYASDLTPPYEARSTDIRLVEEALLGDFLEYLAKEGKVKVRTAKVHDRWGEIDHWGDVGIIEDRTGPKSSHPLRLAPRFDVRSM